MINKIGLQNFRVFDNKVEFDLKPITILTGTNNCGKSVLYKALYLMGNSFVENTKLRASKPYIFEELVFNKEVISKISNLSSNINYNSSNKDIVFSFEYDNKILLGSQYVDVLNKYMGIITVDLVYDSVNIYDKYLTAIDKDVPSRLIDITFYNNGQLISRYTLTSHIKIWKYLFPEAYDKLSEKEKDNMESNPNYEWRLNATSENDKIEMSNYVLNILSAKKRRFIEIVTMLDINKKLIDKKELSDNENELLIELESKGIVYDKLKVEANFEDDPNEYEIRDGKRYLVDPYPTSWYSSAIWFFWDRANEREYEIDNEIVNWSKKYLYDVSEVLFPSLLSILVLGDMDILNSDNNTKEISDLKLKLNEIDILSKSDFINEYKNFELQFVKNVIFLQTVNDDNSLSEDYHSIADYFTETLKGYFEKNNKDNLSAYVQKALGNSLIGKIISEGSCVGLLNDNNDIKYIKELPYSKKINIPSNSDEELKLFANYLQEIISIHESPIDSLNTNLSFFGKELNLSNQTGDIKKYYLINDSNPDNQYYINYGLEFINGNEKLTKDKKWIEYWLNEFKIAKEFSIEPVVVKNDSIEDLVGVQYSVVEESNGVKKKVNITDVGRGVKQVLFLLIKIITSKDGAIITLEEPEVNLHPSMQSKLMDMLYAASKEFKCKFIIETHSEYFIRKLQYLTAKGVVSPDESVIYYLNNPNDIPKDEEQVRKIKVDKLGGLSDTFGAGFYDEAITLKFDLLRLNKTQQN